MEIWRKRGNNFIDIVETYKNLFKTRYKRNLRTVQKQGAISRRVLAPMQSCTKLTPNRHFPDLVNSVTIDSNNVSGRCVQATGPIEPCRAIGHAKAFAAVLDQTNQPYCLDCGIGNNRFTMCDNCNMVAFCSAQRQNCRNNATHQYECGTNFHQIQFGENINIKCAIQMVFVTLVIFQDYVDDLRQHVNGLLNNDRIELLTPQNIDTNLQRFDSLMRLSTKPFVNAQQVITAYDIIIKFPKIERLFQDNPSRNFLQNLLAHFLGILENNAFGIDRFFVPDNDNGLVSGVQIYETFSYFNHSCSPNVIHVIENNVMYLISSRQINANEELCISYKNFTADDHTAERQQQLREGWGFQCNCVRCSAPNGFGNDLGPDIEVIIRDIEVLRNVPLVRYSDGLPENLPFSDYDELRKFQKRMIRECRRNWTPENGAYEIVFRCWCRGRANGGNAVNP